MIEPKPIFKAKYSFYTEDSDIDETPDELGMLQNVK